MDSPFSTLGAEEAKERRQGQRRLLKRIFDCAKEAGCDLILMAGDLFDSKYVTPETEALFLKLLEESPCQVVICTGNHDPYVEGSFYQKNALPKQVHLFTESSLSHFDFPQLGARVYGYSFRGATLKESPLSLAEADTDFQGIRLLCAHGDLQDPLSKYGPITVNDIVKFNINYAALGHVHKAPDGVALPTGIAQYCGIPEGRSFDETGECGVWLVTVEEGAVVADSVILENVTVKAGAEIRYAIIDSGTVVGENARVGEDGATAAAIAVVGADINVPDGKVIKAGAMISRASDLNEEGN